MKTVQEAIQWRRSIRKFKPDPISDEHLALIIEAARLAPSGTNRQPWRFQIIQDKELRKRLAEEATLNQRHVAEAPVCIVCGSEMLTFVKGHPLAPPGGDYFAAESEDPEALKPFIADAQMYTAVAIEHMALMAASLGIGSCWVQRIRFGAMAKILGWPRHRVIHALLLLGYPEGDLPPQRRLAKEQILL